MRRVAVLATAAVLILATPAAAHVSVEPEEVEGGSSPTLTFRVPNERDEGTVKVEVFFPEGVPALSAEPLPTPGWGVAVDADKVTWEGGPIPPDGAQEFAVTVGPLPDRPGPLVFKALQTYASGEVVRWIEEPTAGGAEPEHPAPVLEVVAAAPGEASTTAQPTTTTAEETTTSSTPDDTTDPTLDDGIDDEPATGDPAADDDDSFPIWIVIVVLAALAAAGAIAVALRSRRS